MLMSLSSDGVDRINARVLRGGSFNDFEWFARCACRNDNNIDNLNNNIGFRVVVASHASLISKVSKAWLCAECQKCFTFTDVSRGEPGEIARSLPWLGVFLFVNGRQKWAGEGVQANIKETHASYGLTIPA